MDENLPVFNQSAAYAADKSITSQSNKFMKAQLFLIGVFRLC